MNIWSEEEKQYLKNNYGILTYKEMIDSFLFGRSEKSISNMAVKLGISNKKNYTQTELLRIQSLRTSEVSRLLGRSANAIKIKRSRLYNDKRKSREMANS